MSETTPSGNGKNASSNVKDSLLILFLLLVILSGFLWVLVFYMDSGPSREAAKGKIPSKPPQKKVFVKGIVSQVEATQLSDTSLKVTFKTSKPALCDLAAGYNSLSPKYRKVSDYSHEMNHTLTVRDLLPGQVYYSISGSLKDGSVFREPVRIAHIQPSQSTSSAQGTPEETSVNPSDSQGATGTPVASVVTTGNHLNAHDTSAPVYGAAGSESSQPSAVSTEYSSDTGGQNTESVSWGRPLPNASAESPLGKRALSASTIDRAFGPESLKEMTREKLEKHIQWLHGEFETYGDSRGARELAEAYYEFKDYRKSLRFATAGVKLDDTDIDCHKIRLKVYKKFAMGWKVKETQQKILSLAGRSASESLKKEFARNEQIYGDYKTRGTPQVISIK